MLLFEGRKKGRKENFERREWVIPPHNWHVQLHGPGIFAPGVIKAYKTI
jgi:hypothetical protein